MLSVLSVPTDKDILVREYSKISKYKYLEKEIEKYTTLKIQSHQLYID